MKKHQDCQEEVEKGMACGQAFEQAEQGKTKEQQEQDLAEVCMLCPHSRPSLPCTPASSAYCMQQGGFRYAASAGTHLLQSNKVN